MTDLKLVNQKLWDIDNRIRVKQRSKIVDENFIELGQRVYFPSDDRSRIKRNINENFGSELIEEKSYADD